MGYASLRQGRYSQPDLEYLVTMVCMDRRTVFEDADNAHILADHARSLERSGHLEWLAWVIMPDHFHGLLVLGDTLSLSAVVRRFKGGAAREIGGRIWQPAFHDHALRTHEDRARVARYLLPNPLRSGLAESLETYPFWYCRWLEEGTLPDQLLEQWNWSHCT